LARKFEITSIRLLYTYKQQQKEMMIKKTKKKRQKKEMFSFKQTVFLFWTLI